MEQIDKDLHRTYFPVDETMQKNEPHIYAKQQEIEK